MAKINWAFINYTTSDVLTTHVMSFTRMRGKQTFLDQYAGQQMQVTIRNNTNQSASWVVGTAIEIRYGNDYQNYWVSEIQYNDQPGTTTTSGSGAGSTATVLLDDWMSRAGRIQMDAFAFTQAASITQLSTQITSGGAVMPSAMDWGTTTAGSADAVGGAYTGTLATRINLNMASNTPPLNQYAIGKNLNINAVASNPSNMVTFQPATGSSTGNYFINYQNFRRITAGQNFLNTVTATPPVVAAQTKTNASSVTTYGTRYNGISTENTTVNQTANVAQWLANCQSDPAALRYEITFTDLMQPNTGIDNFFVYLPTQPFVYVKYVVPGSGVTTTAQAIVEGVAYSGTPDQTVFTVYLSPADYYQQFVLDSALFGVLDQNRLGITW